jgi:hypothetical protein
MSVRLNGASVLYDMLKKEKIDYQKKGDDLAEFDLKLNAASGKIIAALPEEIDKVSIEAPAKATPGKPVSLRIEVIGKSGKPIQGDIHLRVEIYDGLGDMLDWSRYTCTKRNEGNQCIFNFTPALNDVTGNWTIKVEELVSGRNATVLINIS